ncbi:hypothetical protein [Bacillus sp. P14.5]|uniref:hypothetical protein n=1 Tax=Bacillus sp. P14.5 TaxID=1983400 RepID=UPI000DE9D76F|nr:hypothetical protein [Bacillus sp. P14.5]
MINIQNYRVDAQRDSIVLKEVTVNADKTLDAVILDRPDPMKRYLLQVTFDPKIQKDSVKEIFGENGERLSKGAGVEELSDGSYIFRKYINIMSYEDPNGIGGPLDFLSKLEIDEMYHREKQ